MPTIETRRAPDGAVTYRAKVRVKGAAQVYCYEEWSADEMELKMQEAGAGVG